MSAELVRPPIPPTEELVRRIDALDGRLTELETNLEELSALVVQTWREAHMSPPASEEPDELGEAR